MLSELDVLEMSNFKHAMLQTCSIWLVYLTSWVVLTAIIVEISTRTYTRCSQSSKLQHGERSNKHEIDELVDVKSMRQKRMVI